MCNVEGACPRSRTNRRRISSSSGILVGSVVTSHIRAGLTLRSAILQDCISLDACLPERFRLASHLKDFQGSAVERDFVASVALNILHVRFLLHSSMQRAAEPCGELINISASMLKLATEVAILKPVLANSGTGFIWKVSESLRAH